MITLQKCVIRQRAKIWGHTECCIGNEILRDITNDLFIILSTTAIMRTIILMSSAFCSAVIWLVLNFITFLNKKSTGTYKLCKTFHHQTSQQNNIFKTKPNITRGRAVPLLPSAVGSVVDLTFARHADVATGCSTCKKFIVQWIQNVWTADNNW